MFYTFSACFILSIGADDAFVVVDHWKLSARLFQCLKNAFDDEEEDNNNDIETSSRCRMRDGGISIDEESWFIDRMTWTIQSPSSPSVVPPPQPATAFATLIFSKIEPLRLLEFSPLSVAYCFFDYDGSRV